MNEAIRLAVFTKFPLVVTGVALEYENIDFDREGKAEWIRLVVLDGDSFNATLSRTKVIKAPGIMVATVFVARGSGTKRLRELCDTISDGFRNLRLTQGTVLIKFGVPTLSGGDAGDRNLYWENVNLPFLAEDTKADAT